MSLYTTPNQIETPSVIAATARQNWVAVQPGQNRDMSLTNNDPVLELIRKADSEQP